MSKLITALLFVSISTTVLAEQIIHIYVEADEYGEYIDFDIPVGGEWVKTDDGYRLSEFIPVSKLPFKSCIFESCLTIRESGHVSFGGFIGDQDAGAEAFFFIPQTADGAFFKAAEPYHFNMEGGDYASGLWSTSADIKIMILND